MKHLKYFKEHVEFGETLQSMFRQIDHPLTQAILAKYRDQFRTDSTHKSEYSWIEAYPNSDGLISFKRNGEDREYSTRVGRMVRSLLNEFQIPYTDKDLEDINNIYRSFLGEKTIEIWEGEKVVDAYQSKNHTKEFKHLCSLGSSCMNGASKEELKFYTDQPNIKVAVMLDESGKIYGRCVLWNADIGGVPGKTLLADRNYVASEILVFQFIRWFNENGIAYIKDVYDPTQRNYDDQYRQDIILNGQRFNHAHVEIDGIKNYTDFPYLDHFRFSDGKDIFNYFESGVDKPICFHLGRDGLYNNYFLIKKSPKTGETIKYVGNTFDRNRLGDIVYSSFYNEWYLKEDTFEVEYKVGGKSFRYTCHKDFIREDGKYIDRYGKELTRFVDINVSPVPDFTDAFDRKVWQHFFIEALRESIGLYTFDRVEFNKYDNYYNDGPLSHSKAKFEYRKNEVLFTLYKYVSKNNFWKRGKGGVEKEGYSKPYQCRLKIYPTRVIFEMTNRVGKTMEWRYKNWEDFNNRSFADIRYFTNLPN